MKRGSGVRDSNEDDVNSEKESKVESEDKNPGFYRTLNVSSMEKFWKEINSPIQKVKSMI